MAEPVVSGPAHDGFTIAEPTDGSNDGAGPLLVGRYRLGPLLGRGGAATVYRGHDLLLDRTVAIKLLHQHPQDGAGGHGVEGDGDTERAMVQLRREARLVAGLNDPHIIAVYDIGVYRNSVFAVLEYLPGQSLRELLAECAPLPVERVVTIGVAVCAGLHAAHGHGVIHRDVTPANILVGADGTTKITDFGIARATTGVGSTATTGEGLVRGTPSYMSPEQVRGQTLDARSDVYSLGCCLYQMATGTPPFRAPELVALAMAHTQKAPDPPSEHNRAVPPALDAVIVRALAKNPEHRYSSTAALQAALAGLDHEAGAVGVRRPTTTVLPTRTRRGSTLEDTQYQDFDTGAAGESDTDEPEQNLRIGTLRRRLGLVLIVIALAAIVASLVLGW
jgi:serine/threonine-protein kinase